MSLGDELLAVALGYARARLDELKAAALQDVDAFAATLGVPAFADAGDEVAALLTTARNELDAATASLAARDFIGGATHLGNCANAVDQAVAKVPGGKSVEQLLAERIGWGTVTPKGLARQLGLPASAPGLALAGGALTYTLSAPGKSLSPAPLTLGFDGASLTAKLRLDGTAPLFSLSVAFDGMQAGVGGGPVASLLAGASGSVGADIAVGFDTSQGLTLSGSAGKRVVLPARTAAGPLALDEVALELPGGDLIDIGSTIDADLGVIKATVDGAGVRLRIDPGAVAGGDNPLSLQIKPPTGIGLDVDAGIIRGGGFLGVRSGGYGGALQLRLGPVEVTAVGLLTLEPDFALVIVMSVRFMPAIDLTFGFTLNAVGGLLGLQHRMDTDALRAQLPTGGLDHILFPEDVVAAAPRILDTLEAVFPVSPGSIVIGPMVEVGWGRPVSFLTAQLGVLISLPNPKVVIIGRVRIALPAPELPIVDLRATVYGEITEDHLLVLVSLRGSRLASFTITGDIGLLLRWGGSPEFAISAGGFHPRYSAPPELAGMQRLGMDLSPPAILQLRAESYFALTSNSVQLGSRVEMGADLGVASISGHFGFDALLVWSPRFMFMFDLGIGITVRALGVTLCGVSVQLHVEGPAPWRAEGHAEVEILWWTIGVDVGPFTWGDDDNPPPLPAHPRQLVHGALHRNPGAWQALTPPDADRVAKLAPASPSDTDVTVHPMGMFDVRQHAVPLETDLARVGANPVPARERRVHLGQPTADGMPVGPLSEVRDEFSAGNFLELTDDQKLSRPSFEQMPAGVRMRPPGEEAPYAESRGVALRYETFICDDPPPRRGLVLDDVLLASSAAFALAAGAAGVSPLRARTRYATVPDPMVMGDPAEVVQADKARLAAVDSYLTYTHAAERLTDATHDLVRAGVL